MNEQEDRFEAGLRITIEVIVALVFFIVPLVNSTKRLVALDLQASLIPLPFFFFIIILGLNMGVRIFFWRPLAFVAMVVRRIAGRKPASRRPSLVQHFGYAAKSTAGYTFIFTILLMWYSHFPPAAAVVSNDEPAAIADTGMTRHE